MERSYVVSVRWQRNQVFHRMKILSLEKKSNHNPTGFRQWVKVAKSSGLCYALAMGTWNQKKQTQVFVTIIGQELPELTPVEIVGYEVVEARIPESLGSGSVNHLL